MILQHHREVDDSGGEISYDNCMVSPVMFTTDYVKVTINATDQIVSNLICITLIRKLKYWFPQINLPGLAEEKYTNNVFFFSEGTGGH